MTTNAHTQSKRTLADEPEANSPTTLGSPTVPHPARPGTASLASTPRDKSNSTNTINAMALANMTASVAAGAGSGSAVVHSSGPSRRGSTVNGRRGSGSVLTPSGSVVAFHTRTHDEQDFPHAEKSG